MEALARDKQEEHREASVQEGLILEFIERPVPDDWVKWDIDQRRAFWSGLAKGGEESYTMVERDKVCAAEVWCELYCKPISDMRKSDAREINAVLERLPGWRSIHGRFGKAYGDKQRGFSKK